MVDEADWFTFDNPYSDLDQRKEANKIFKQVADTQNDIIINTLDSTDYNEFVSAQANWQTVGFNSMESSVKSKIEDVFDNV